MIGTLFTYYEDRCYGFIRIDGSRDEVFAHLAEFERANIVPEVGLRLRFRSAVELSELA